jgi:hypothetical protein
MQAILTIVPWTPRGRYLTREQRAKITARRPAVLHGSGAGAVCRNCRPYLGNLHLVGDRLQGQRGALLRRFQAAAGNPQRARREPVLLVRPHVCTFGDAIGVGGDELMAGGGS